MWMMVIKRKTEPEMIMDVEETPLTHKKVNMKLNPKKCSFRMEECKFLGYIVTFKGIRVNPEKAKAVVNMPSPGNLKQMQQLSDKLSALNIFLSKVAEKALPCLDTLKKCTIKKDFHWRTYAKEAFRAMKKLIAELPTLTASKKGEELMVYLSAANEAVSAVLLVERDVGQDSIHYMSKTLQGAEISYPPMEKLVLALVNTARRLRRYFQGHTIKLEAYGIKYALRSMIKGQVLADFLAEDNSTQVKTDGSNDTLVEEESTREQKAPETKTPKNLKIETDIWKPYTDESNNDVEYEALLTGLRIATNIKYEGLTKRVLIEELNGRSVDAAEVIAIIEEVIRTWMTPIQGYIEHGILPEDAAEARTIREKAHNYTIEEGVLYRNMALPKVGNGHCGASSRSSGKIKYLIVAVDYFAKWFKIPANIITDNETQLINDPFKSWAKGLGIQLISTLVYRP
ncbi:reverse transcriptase domain-containing protein [Tanacetum coccineum]